MSLTITKYVTINPKIEPCLCGSSDISDSATRSSDCWDIYVSVTCNSCGLNLHQDLRVTCHGEPTIENAYMMIIAKWNKLMSKEKPLDNSRPL